MAEPKPEVCTIRIMFPVDSDEQAIDCKRKIAAILSNISEAQVQFSLMTVPSKVNLPQKNVTLDL